MGAVNLITAPVYGGGGGHKGGQFLPNGGSFLPIVR
ncbi:hypothetical protein PTH_2259 [Pelotomaculum thermopropionicum SI]|uniref:Uncharacterized protein n=1 Tax=Pelotomaculum thermopropionicum (strain DSM 13744 / JCM 10971 / SI) TaxID=370438 RepID=A5CZX7_PELTS|nr:hypothetical protein PTH_2259 [Pelotomaculum thermopropionicum SI]